LVRTLAGYILFFALLASINVEAKTAGYSHIQKDTFELTIQGNLLILKANQASLKDILRALSHKTGVPIEIDRDLEKDVTIALTHLSLEQVIKKLVPNYAIVFSQEGEKDSYKVYKAIVIDSCDHCPETIIAGVDRPPSHQVPDYKPKNTANKTADLTASSANFPQKTSSGIKKKHPARFVANELIVKFKPHVSTQDIQDLLSITGANVKSEIEQLRYYVLMLPGGLSVGSALNIYQQNDAIDIVEPNYIIPLQVVPDDPEFTTQWALDNTGQTGGLVDADIDAVEAWGIEQGDHEVVIAIIDTGVDYTHEDLADNIWHNPGEIPDNGVDDDNNGYIDDVIGWDFVDVSGGSVDEDFEIPDNDPMDKHGHGTHVAGIAGAVTNNGIGVSGVCWNCKIMPLKAGYKAVSGSGEIESEAAAQSILYAAENGARVINLSWGDYRKSNLIDDAITFATNRGMIICAAAGNENASYTAFPASSENMAVVAVGASDNKDKKALFSNYGSEVDVSAPGVDIFNTYPKNSYKNISGSSTATPHVSGLAALLFSYFDDIAPIEVKTRIMRSVDVLEDLYEKNSTSGRINLNSALKYVFTKPHLITLNPIAAHEGDKVSILGDTFGSIQNDGKVIFFPDNAAEIISWSNSIIICKVPKGAQNGEVTIETSEGISNGIGFSPLVKYYEETLIDSEYLNIGQPQGWKQDDRSWFYYLPFSFPFFGKRYNSLYICSNGYLDFTNSLAAYTNSYENFKNRAIIAPLWDDLMTNGTSQLNEDIYIHTPTPDSVCLRWAAELYETGDPVNIEVVLFENGAIRFNYGEGNSNISPLIGISDGNGLSYRFATYNGSHNLDKKQSVWFSPVEISFAIALDLGWNLISLPFKPANNQVGQVLNYMLDGIETVWGYTDGQWHIFSPEHPDITNLSELKPGYGYWINTSKNGMIINITGRRNDDTVNLKDGWNLVGRNSTNPIAADEFLTRKGCSTAWGYHKGAWDTYTFGNPKFNDLNKIEPGRGYWLYCGQGD